MSQTPTTRTNAPAYLQRYLERKRVGAEQNNSGDVQITTANANSSQQKKAYAELGEPPYIQEARARAEERAWAEKREVDAPPGGVSRAYALNTVSPRELGPPPELVSRRYGDSVDVRLLRHGQTQGYSTDAGLSPLGRWQAHRRGQDLSRGMKPGMRIRIVHAETARARETALALREGFCEGMARYGVEAEVEQLRPSAHFRNFQVWCDGAELDVTAAFMRYATTLEKYEERKAGDWPGWLTEMERFWNVESGGGDPITHWLTNPMQYFEPAALCVRRFWKGILEEVGDGASNLRVFVCTHSGPIRAVAAAAVGHDPGEPFNLEDVRIRLFGDRKHAVVTYRGRGVEIEVPTVCSPSWASARD